MSDILASGSLLEDMELRFYSDVAEIRSYLNKDNYGNFSELVEWLLVNRDFSPLDIHYPDVDVKLPNDIAGALCGLWAECRCDNLYFIEVDGLPKVLCSPFELASSSLENSVKKELLELGLDLCGVVKTKDYDSVNLIGAGYQFIPDFVKILNDKLLSKS